MPQALASLGSVFSGAQGGAQQLGGITAGIGGAGQIMNMIQQAQAQNKVNSVENMSPQALGQRVSAATQPLNAGLTQSVGNIVQANMAERGLAQAPGVFAASEAQALAPFEQQNQQTALALISQQLGLPMQYLQALMGRQPGNMSNLFTQLALGRGQSPTGGATVPPGTTYGPYDWQLGASTPTATPPTFGGGDGGGSDYGGF
jgi:hypothetical protein